MSQVSNSLSIAGLAMQIPGTVQVCLTLGGSIIQLIRDYHDSDHITEALALKIDSKWKNVQKILTNIHRVSARLDIDLESQIRPVLIKLAEVLMKAREKAAKMGMLSRPEAGDSVTQLGRERRNIRPAGDGSINPVGPDRRPRAAAVCWSKGDLQNLLSQCEEWEALISSRLLIIILFESKLLGKVAEEQNWQGPIVSLDDNTPEVSTATVVSSTQISSNWCDAVEEININPQNYTTFQIQRSMVRYMQCTMGSSCNYLVESRRYKFGMKEKIESKQFKTFKADLYGTARMLKGAIPQLMSILPSPGIICDKSQDDGFFELLYNVPSSYTKKPRSLRDLLMSSAAREKDGSFLIPLNYRVRLANRIAIAVLYLHSGHFVHKRIKPENILIFETDDENTFPSIIGYPFLVGFDRSRAEAGDTTEEGDVVIANCIYQHPERWGIKAHHRFRMLHDVYSLGVVLLEIGLWKSFVKWDNVSSRRSLSWRGFDGLFDGEELKIPFKPHHVMERFIEAAKKLLPPKMGQRYTNVVVTCLSGGIEESEVDSAEDEREARLGLSFIKNVLSKLETVQV